MTKEDNTVVLGMMPVEILSEEEDPPLFFAAEMEKGSGRVRPSDDGAEKVEEAVENYARILSENTELTHEQARDQLGLK